MSPATALQCGSCGALGAQHSFPDLGLVCTACVNDRWDALTLTQKGQHPELEKLVRESNPRRGDRGREV